jgi:cytochrome c oxidase subunit 2
MRRAQALAAVLAAAGLGLVATGVATGDGGATSGDGAAAAPARPAATAAARPGLDVWIANGCGSCHALAAAGSTGFIGPDLDEVLPGQTAAQVLESIAAPNASFTPGWDSGAMPEDFAGRIDGADLRRLVGFLLDATAQRD